MDFRSLEVERDVSVAKVTIAAALSNISVQHLFRVLTFEGSTSWDEMFFTETLVSLSNSAF